MKRIIITLGIAVMAVASAVVFNESSKDDNATEYALNLSQSDDTMCDMVFDKDGNVLSVTTYSWNSDGTKGKVLYAYSK